jgi:hypothetical protein
MDARALGWLAGGGAVPGAAGEAGGRDVVLVLKLPSIDEPTLVTSATLPASIWLLKKVQGMVIAVGSGKRNGIAR